MIKKTFIPFLKKFNFKYNISEWHASGAKPIPIKLVYSSAYLAGACPGFLKGGGPISLGSLKKVHQIIKGGVQWSDGGVQYISLPRTTNLAYLDAKE